MNLPRKRLLRFSELPPQAVVGRTLYLIDFQKYINIIHQGKGWDDKSRDEQGQEEFSFDGKLLSIYARRVLGRELKDIYFPAAYRGKVAGSLAEAGHNVFASDLSEHWVSHLRSIGLHAERRSFEDLPERHFDALVCFEPYCLPNIIMYIAMLRAFAAALPILEIKKQSSFLKFAVER